MNVNDLSSKNCSGCTLCASVCPAKCITMDADALGYTIPIIDSEKCIDCGLCVKKCIIVNPEETTNPIETFAAVRSDKSLIQKSSSGGVFAAIAEKLISEGWMIAGCIMDENLIPHHILTSDPTELQKMYGSKYVQSNTLGIYITIMDALESGKNVLFSGTPCQVAAAKRYTKNHVNLLTIEVICHGVPNNKMLQSSLACQDIKHIKSFIFRDKNQGWTYNNLIVYDNGDKKKINHRLSSYMTYFLEGETYRDSCYECPYAKPERVSDITIGDFWGVARRRSDLKRKIDIEKGVSCLIVNSERGKNIISICEIDKFQVLYEDIKDGNGPLNHPSIHTDKRDKILYEWSKNTNWEDVQLYWKKNDYKLYYLIWSFIPSVLQHKLRLLIGRR